MLKNTKTDQEIVALSLQDDKYFAELVDRYESKLTRYIFRISSLSLQSAEDILQEVFLKIYQNLNDFDPDYSFSSWAYRITHNETISYIRKNKSRPQTISLENENDAADFINLLPDDTDLPAEYDSKEKSLKIKKAVYELPSKYREVLVLRYLEDMSYEEISDILKKPVNTVSVRINRAKQKLKSQLTDLK